MKLAKRPIGRAILTAFIIITLASGLYLLLLTLAPMLPAAPLFGVQAPEVSMAEEPGARGNRLYIPKLRVDIPILEGGESVLEKGAWHRFPSRGSPEIGGNFIISAHRFELGWTPQQTRVKSPFYDIDKLKPGDELFIDYGKKRYVYSVVRLYDVPPTATEIEAPSQEAKMTLYSCDLRGAAAGRLVVEAKPI